MMFCALAKAASNACSWPGRTSSIACSRTVVFTAQSRRAVANGLDVVPVGIEHERAVIRRVIHRTDTRLAVVFSACSHRGRVERIDFRARGGGKGDVSLVISRRACGEPELRAILAHAREAVELHQYRDSER